MRTYKITFGTGADSMTMVNQAGDLATLLVNLKTNGWETEEITSINEEK